MWLGVIAAVAGLGFGLWGGFMAWQQYLALDALRSAPIDYPFPALWAGAGLLLAGGFLAGMGVGLTSKSKKVEPAATAPATPAPLPPASYDEAYPPAPNREPTPPAA